MFAPAIWNVLLRERLVQTNRKRFILDIMCFGMLGLWNQSYYLLCNSGIFL